MTVSMVCAHMYIDAHVKSVFFFETDSHWLIHWEKFSAAQGTLLPLPLQYRKYP